MKSGGSTPKAARRSERLARALRANLKRRKQQSRGRVQGAKPGENPSGTSKIEK